MVSLVIPVLKHVYVFFIIELPDNEIKATSFLFFVAGYETTASLLRFSAHILSLNPHIDQRLYEEIEENIGKVMTT